MHGSTVHDWPAKLLKQSSDSAHRAVATRSSSRLPRPALQSRASCSITRGSDHARGGSSTGGGASSVSASALITATSALASMAAFVAGTLLARSLAVARWFCGVLACVIVDRCAAQHSEDEPKMRAIAASRTEESSLRRTSSVRAHSARTRQLQPGEASLLVASALASRGTSVAASEFAASEFAASETDASAFAASALVASALVASLGEAASAALESAALLSFAASCCGGEGPHAAAHNTRDNASERNRGR